MSLDEDIRTTLRKHADDIEPRANAWSGVEHGVRRARRQRVATTAFVAVLVIAAGAAVGIPRLRHAASPKPGGFATEPSAQPTAQPSVNCSPPNACATASPAPRGGAYRDEGEGWQITYPAAWKVTRFEGHTEFWPNELTSPEQGSSTFFIALWLEQGVDLRTAERNSGSSDWQSGTDLAGRHTVHQATYGTSEMSMVVWDGGVLHVNMTGAESLWSTYATDAKAAVQSLEATADGNYPTGEVATRDGRVDDGVTYDAYTQWLVTFLDARIDGGGAEQYVGTGVVEYSPAAHMLSLYGYSGYEVTGRTDGNNQTAEFKVSLERTDASGSPLAPVIEWITMAKYAGMADVHSPYQVSQARAG